MKPAVFVDRDGTLIEEVNFLSRLEDLRLFSYTAAAIKLFKDNGFRVIVVTNQSGIGRGKYDEAAMHAIHAQIQIELSGAIDAFYFCPHLPRAGCTCRKPRLGMVEAAQKDFEIDMSRSWFVGDKDLDVEAGKNADVRTALVLTGYGRKHQNKLERQPDFICEHLGSAAARIVNVGTGNESDREPLSLV